MSMAATAWVTWLCACARYRVGVRVILDPRALVFYHVTDGDKRKREELWGREWCSSVSLAFIFFVLFLFFCFCFAKKNRGTTDPKKLLIAIVLLAAILVPRSLSRNKK